MEEKNIQVSLESKVKRKNQLTASKSNRLRRFGDRMPELLESIDKAHAQGRFIKKPVGPIGEKFIYITGSCVAEGFPLSWFICLHNLINFMILTFLRHSTRKV